MNRRLVRSIAFASCLLWAASSSARAGDDITGLFESWDKPSEASYTAAQQRFDQLKASDARTHYAMALVAAKNRRTIDASKWIDSALSTDKSLLGARRVQILLSASRNDTSAVQSQIRDLGALLTTDKLPDVESRETAEWVGRVMGFYAGPGTGRMPAADLARLEGDLKSKLPASLNDAMAEGRTAALRSFAELQKEQATARSEIKAKLLEKQRQDQYKNDAALAEASQKKAQAEQALQSARSDVEKKALADSKTLGKLERDFQQKENKAERQQDHVVHAAKRLANGRPAENPNSIETRRQVTKGKMAADVQKAENVIASENQVGSNLESLEKDAKRYEGLEKTLTAKKAQLDKPPSDNPPTAIDAKIAAVSTYAAIDLDAEKDRLLTSLQQR